MEQEDVRTIIEGLFHANANLVEIEVHLKEIRYCSERSRMKRKRKPTRSAGQIHRETQERWQRAKAMFEERLEHHRRRREQEEQAAGRQG
jgi:hypothetical protein